MLAEEETTKTTVAYPCGWGDTVAAAREWGAPQTKPGMLRGLFHLHENPQLYRPHRV